MNDLVIMERQHIVDIADAIRNKTGVNDEMTLEQMAEQIIGFSGGDSSESATSIFTSHANGTIPEYEIGAAISEFILYDMNFNSSAIGTLQEG